MPVAVEVMPLAGLVDLVNGWGRTPRAEAGEQDWPYPTRELLLRRLGALSFGVPAGDAPLVAVADRLHPVFAADDPAARAALVNDLLALTAVRPALHSHHDQLRGGWLVDDPQHTLLAAAAVALRTQLAEHPAGRLGTCDSSRCADAYVDTSHSGQRRYCSTTCQTRARVAAYRRRRTGT